jgi:hypothetical protein
VPLPRFDATRGLRTAGFGVGDSVATDGERRRKTPLPSDINLCLWLPKQLSVALTAHNSNFLQMSQKIAPMH